MYRSVQEESHFFPNLGAGSLLGYTVYMSFHFFFTENTIFTVLELVSVLVRMSALHLQQLLFLDQIRPFYLRKVLLPYAWDSDICVLNTSIKFDWCGNEVNSSLWTNNASASRTVKTSSKNLFLCICSFSRNFPWLFDHCYGNWQNTCIRLGIVTSKLTRLKFFCTKLTKTKNWRL